MNNTYNIKFKKKTSEKEKEQMLDFASKVEGWLEHVPSYLLIQIGHEFADELNRYYENSQTYHLPSVIVQKVLKGKIEK